jgi:hypothetical protein
LEGLLKTGMSMRWDVPIFETPLHSFFPFFIFLPPVGMY